LKKTVVTKHDIDGPIVSICPEDVKDLLNKQKCLTRLTRLQDKIQRHVEGSKDFVEYHKMMLLSYQFKPNDQIFKARGIIGKFLHLSQA
jgi:hypothetical protein